jgi:Flp pilus assembly protein TadG
MMANRLRRFVKDEGGQTLIELGIVLPSYFALLFGFFGFSVAFFGMMNANYACNVAVRYAAVHSSTSRSPVTTAQLQTLVTSNLWLPASMTPTVTITHTHSGTSYSNFTGVVVGDLAGATVTWTSVPIWHISSIPIGANAYRMVTR